jgi:hypothetical protein
MLYMVEPDRNIPTGADGPLLPTRSTIPPPIEGFHLRQKTRSS